jgi:hypothetical protein
MIIYDLLSSVFYLHFDCVTHVTRILRYLDGVAHLGVKVVKMDNYKSTSYVVNLPGLRVCCKQRFNWFLSTPPVVDRIR